MNQDFKTYLEKAKENRFAIGAFNFSTLEQLQSIFEAAKKKRSPIIVQTSQSEAKFIGLKTGVGLIKLFKEIYSVPAILNLDHGKDFNLIKDAIEAGYDMVHFDGSELPLEENLTKTKEVLDYAHSHNVLVEGELGYLRGSSEVHEETPFISPEDFTDPKTANDFVQKTGVNFLAISVGNIHGMLKGGEMNPDLDVERIQKINSETNAFLTLHGGSGTKEDNLKEAIKAGIVKINLNTELRLAHTNALRTSLQKDEEIVKPYKYMEMSKEKVREVVEAKIEIFGSVNMI